MTFAERVTARAVEGQRARAEAQSTVLIEAGLTVLRRDGAAALTVAEVLREAGLSTRAFYRYFASKDELVLAIFEQESLRAQDKLLDRVQAARSPRTALEAWIDETLALAFDGRRARRTGVLAAEGSRLQAEYPAEFLAIVGSVLEPLAAILRDLDVENPELTARSIHAVTWLVVVDKLNGGDMTLAAARRHVVGFCLPAVGINA